MSPLGTLVVLVLMVMLVAYPAGVAFVVARAAHQRAGLAAGIAAAAVTVAGWCTAPAAAFVLSLPVLLWLRLRPPVPEPESMLPRAKVV